MDDTNKGVDFDVEQSFIKRIGKSIQNTIYSIMYELLNIGEKISFPLRTFLILIETIQVLNFQFSPHLESMWKNSSVTSTVAKIIRYTSIYPNLIQGQLQNYQVAVYFAASLMMFSILQICLIVFSLERKKGIFQWPVQILKQMTELLSNVLYIPLFQLFLSVFQCKSQSGSSQLVMEYFPEQQCFTGSHITLTFIGAFFAIFVFIYSAISSLLYFDCRMVSQDCNSKLTSRGEFAFFLYKTFLVILTTFLDDDHYKILTIALIAVGSFLMFEYYNLNLNHNHYWVAKIISAQHIVNTWTSLMMTLAYISQYQQFDQSINIWLIGLPFIIGISIIRREYRIDILLTNTNLYDVLSQPLTELPYITKLLSFYYTDKCIQILLEGFLDYHSWLCNKEECASKRKIVKTTKFSKEMRQQGECEKMIRLILAIKGMYYYALQRFPNNTYLRIMYALFLLDKMLSKQQAMQELLNTELEGPAFDEQFIIFRYKRIIENELKVSTVQSTIIQKNKKEGNSEMVNELSIQNHQDACRSSIEKSANLHVEFWSQLSEDQPDLGKLSEIGFKINIINQQADEQWNKLQQISSYNPQLMRLYSKYKLEILNDKEGGYKIINELNKTNNQSSKQQGYIDLTSDPKPTIVISAEDDQFGIITNANLAASGALGYHKVEVINRNINAIMPYLYAQHHDKFIESYLQTLEARLLNMDRLVPAKQKNDYILMVIAYVRHVPSLIHGTQFIGQFQIKNQKKNLGFLLINLEGEILNINPQCINILQIDQKRLGKRQSNMNNTIEGFMDNLEAFKQKNGAPAKMKEFGKNAVEFDAVVQVQEVQLKIGLVGYVVQIERVNTIQQNNKNSLLQTKRDAKSQIPYHIEFKIDPSLKIYYGEFQNGMQSQVKGNNEERSIIFNSNLAAESYRTDNLSAIADQLSKTFNKAIQDTNNNIFTTERVKENNDEVKVEPAKDYAKGIRCVRLIGNKMIDIEDLKLQEEEQEEELKEESEYVQNIVQQKDENDNDDDRSNIGSIFKKRDRFIKFINDTQFLKSQGLKLMQYYSIVFILIALGLCLFTFFIVSNELQEAKQRYQFLAQSNQLTADGQIILSKVQQLYFLNMNIIIPTDSSAYQQQQRKDIETYQNDLQSLQISLESNTLDMLAGHRELLNNAVVRLKNLLAGQVSYTYHTISDATRQIISASNFVQNMTLSQFIFSQSQFYFLESNLLNDYNIQLNNVTNYYVLELQNWVNQKELIIYIQLVVIGLFTLVSIILIFPFYNMMILSQKQVLQVFLDIPLSKVKKLYIQCETFLTQLQSGNDDELQTEISDQVDVDDDHQLLLNRKGNKPRKIKINLRNQQSAFLPLLITLAGLWGYYLLVYFLTVSFSNNLTQFIQEFNSTSTLENFFGFSTNNLKQLLIDNSFPIRNIDSAQQVMLNINEMYNINSVIQQEHSKNLQNHDSSYNSDYASVYMSNCCNILTNLKQVSDQDCQNFLYGSVTQGMAIVIPRYIEIYRNIKSQYDKIVNQYSGQEQRNQLNQLINSNDVNNIFTISDTYIKNLFRYLCQSFISSISKQNDDQLNLRITLLIISVGTLAFIYLFIWTPILSNLNKNIEKVRSMILMIPLDICEGVKSIRNLLSKYMNSIVEEKAN
ncbi:hypothetical protein ABPG72_013550 [Tetrahymena utriculariae]